MLGVAGVASLPFKRLTLADTWVLQVSVGSVPSIKYSVITLLPLGSEVHKFEGNNPESLHTFAVTNPVGASISVTL